MNPLELKVSDIKQYFYCPRVVYFYYVLPVSVKTTFKMDYGGEAHIRWEDLEKRRTFKRYGLAAGERFFGSFLKSERLGLVGKLDLHIKAAGEYIPVEFKYTSGTVGLGHKYQLAAYAMLLEDTYNVSVKSGFIYLIVSKKIEEVFFLQDIRIQVKKIMSKIRKMVTDEEMPEANRIRSRCRDCEYLNFCGDVW